MSISKQSIFSIIIYIFLISLMIFRVNAQIIKPSKPPERGFVSIKAAEKWDQALVSGNGKYGALVFGQPLDETIVLNHARLFMPLYEPIPPVNTALYLTAIRQMLSKGEYQQAADFVVELSKKEGYKEKRWTDPFIPAFNIKVIMDANGVVSNYSRSVDFSTGVTLVKWSDANGSFQRRLFVSRADSVVVLSIQGQKKEKVSCLLKLAQQSSKDAGGWGPEKMFSEGIKDYKNLAVQGWLTYRSSFKKSWPGILQGYEGVSRVVVRGGSSVVTGDEIHITGADEVLVLTKIELLKDYQHSKIEDLKRSLTGITSDFNILLKRHTKLHGEIFNRSRLLLNKGVDNNFTSEELLASSKFGKLNPALLEKEYDAARYNIISSSDDLFPNLQGLWSGTYGPPWSGDFTMNGNVQCAISADLSSNMAECLKPYFRFLEDHMDEFRLNANRLYGCRGIYVPTKATNHGLNNHFDETWCMTFWTAGAGWASQFFYDYYLYTGNLDFLKNHALPFMREAALFYEDFLKEGPDGKLLFTPSYSPENNPGNSKSQACVNAAMDIGVATELLNNCIAASERLGVGKEDIIRWKAMLTKMPEYLINDKGAVKEWSTPLLDDNESHRHCSHLYALYNGLPKEIAENVSLKKAFEIALENRLNLRRREFKGESVNGRPPGEMAFGLVLQGFVAASLHKGDDCGEILDWLANNYWNSNFVTTHNPKNIFNTDLSGGLPALVIRMLVDSQPGWIELLPAWSSDMPSGKIEGIALRGQIIVKEFSWNRKNISLILRSAISQKIQLKIPGEILSISGSKRLNITSNKNQYYLSLPKKEYVSIQLVLK